MAYLRSLTPELPDGIDRATFHQVLLSPERQEKVETFELDRLVGFTRLLTLVENEDEEEEVLKGLMVFPRILVGDDETTLSLLFDREGGLQRMSTLGQVRLAGVPPDEVDQLLDALGAGRPSEALMARAPDLAARLNGYIEAAPGLMRILLDQEREDRKAAVAAYTTYTEHPETLSPGARLYMQSCAACHGFTGRVVGPMVIDRDAWPRALADGSVMSRLSDSYLKSLVRKGGLHWNLSGVMPAYRSFKDNQIDQMVAYIRTLSDTPADGRCPCATLGQACDHGASGQACGCASPDKTDILCSNMRR